MVAGRTLYVQVNARGEVVAAAAQQGLSVGGAEVLKAGGDWAVLALNGEDVRRAPFLAAFPFGEGCVGLCRADGAPALAGEVGEFLAGVWTRLAAQVFKRGGRDRFSWGVLWCDRVGRWGQQAVDRGKLRKD